MNSFEIMFYSYSLLDETLRTNTLENKFLIRDLSFKRSDEFIGCFLYFSIAKPIDTSLRATLS